jgi:tripeptide aminopeptidase
MRIRCLLLVGLSVLVTPLVAQSPDTAVRGLVDGPKFKQAAAFIQSDQERFVRELVTLTEIPAPPFKEQARAQAFMRMLREHGLSDVEIDAEGNVTGIRRGISPKPAGEGGLLLVNAHLDTVFPEGTDVKVTRQGTRSSSPSCARSTRRSSPRPATSSLPATSAKKARETSAA